MLSLLHGPTLTFVQNDYCENHSFDYMDRRKRKLKQRSDLGLPQGWTLRGARKADRQLHLLHPGQYGSFFPKSSPDSSHEG